MLFHLDRTSKLRTVSNVLIIISCFFALSIHRASAQVDEGSISGTVQDASGAVVPNAQVTLLNTDQGLSLVSKTNESGEYTFSPVRIGNYSLDVTAPGFERTTQKNLTVNVSQRLQVNVQLKLGATNETVEVSTAPPQLQTDEASVGQVVTEKSVNDLPLNGRNFTFLAQLGAGTQTPQADTRGNAASGAFSANGLRPSQNNYLLDGIDTTPTPSTSSTGLTSLFFLQSTQSRSSRFKPLTSAPNWDAPQVPFSTPRSSPALTAFTAQRGSSSATISWMPPIGSKITPESKKVSCV